MNDAIAADLVKAVNRVAAAYEEMVLVAKAKQQRPSGGSETSEQAATRSVTRKPKGDILTSTGHVLTFGVVVGANGEPKLTKKGAKYWKLKLDNGFEAMVFSETQATRCSKAYQEGLPLIVEYVQDGKYANIEGVKLGAGAAATKAAAGEQKLSCGHFPSEQCDCAF